ncbi:MAG TPA: hypothetical protein VGK16_06475 [Candidatus Limnocylindrales bacterium]
MPVRSTSAERTGGALPRRTIGLRARRGWTGTAAAVTALLLVGTLAQPVPARAASTAEVSLSGRGTAQVDGVQAAGEWDRAGRLDFRQTLAGVDGTGAVAASLFVMNDDQNLYLGVRVAAVPGCSYYPSFAFDNDGDGDPFGLGSDSLAAHVDSSAAGSIELLDAFVWPEANIGLDTFTATGYPPAGTNDGSAAGGHPNGTATWVELAHPIDSSDDAHDFSRSIGATIGMLLLSTMQGGQCGTCVGAACYGTTTLPGLGQITVRFVGTDDVAPLITSGPTVEGAVRSTLGGGSTLVRWAGTDGTGLGIDRYQVQQQRDGGTWTTVATTTTTRITRALSFGHTYRFRVRPRDLAGNWGSWATGPSIVPTLTQSTSSLVHYPIGPWTTQLTSNASGGATRWSKATSARASFTFTGRAIAWVSATGSTRGRVGVYVDGIYRGTVSLYASTTHWRRIVFSGSWRLRGTHTIQLRSVLSGHRIDVDAFVVYH